MSKFDSIDWGDKPPPQKPRADEFDEAAAVAEHDKFWETVKGCHGRTLAVHMARFQFEKMRAELAGAINEKMRWESVATVFADNIDQLKAKSARLAEALEQIRDSKVWVDVKTIAQQALAAWNDGEELKP